MFRKFLIFTVLFALTASAGAESVDKKVIEMKSTRPCVATIEKSGSNFRIDVKMRSVSCFSTAMNQQISRQKAELFALSGLLKFLEPKSSQKMLECSGFHVENVRFIGTNTFISASVPVEGVKVVNAPKIPLKTDTKNKSADNRRMVSAGGLLQVKSDYLNTIQLLFDNLASVSFNMPTTLEDVEDFRLAIAEHEDRLEDLTDALREEIKDEIKLLTNEKRELYKALDQRYQAEMTRLDTIAEILKLPVMKDAQIDEAYREILVAEPFLLEVGGAWVVETDDTYYLVGVGLAPIPETGKSASIRLLNAKKVAQVYAQATIAKYVETHVTSHEKITDKIVVITENGTETSSVTEEYLEIIESRAKIILRNVRTVGTWLDEAEEYVFVAVVSRVEKKPHSATASR